MALRSVAVQIRAQVEGYLNGLRTAGTATRSFADEITRMGRTNPAALASISNQIGVIGLAMVGATGYVIHLGMAFDKQMSAVQAATHASTATMNQLRDAALEAGKETQYSATEAARGVEELAKAGVSAQAILGGGLRGALSLAAAGNISVGEAAETAATAMTQFNLAGYQVGHVADLLAAGAGKAQGDVHDMGLALKQSGLVASQFGLSVEDTVGTLTAFAKAGLLGSDAGTSFKQMLLSLANPSQQAQQRMRELGISAYDVNGKFVGIVGLADQLRTKLAGLTQAQRDQTLAMIFGSDAIRAANVLYQQGGEGIRKWIESTNEAGYAADTARARTDNLAGDLERLRGSLETLAIESSSGASQGLRILAQRADGVVGAFAAMPAPIQSAVVVLTGLVGLSLVAGAGFLRMQMFISQLTTSLAGMGPMGERAAAGINRVVAAAGKLAVGVGAALVGIQLVGLAWRAFVDQPGDIKITSMAKALEEFGRTGSLATKTTQVLGSNMKELEATLAVLDNNAGANFAHRWSSFVEGISGTGDLHGTFTRSKEDIQKIDEALASLVAAGKPAQAAQAFDRLAEAAARQGVSVNELKAGLPQYAAALEAGTQTQQDSAAATSAQDERFKALNATLADAIDKAGSLKDAFDRLNGKAIESAQAQIAVQEAAIKLREAAAGAGDIFDINTGRFNFNSEAGRRVASAMLDMAEKARDSAQAVYAETGSVSQASAEFDRWTGSMYASLRAAGLTDAQARSLIATYASMPPLVATTVRAYGIEAINVQLAYLRQQLAMVNGSVARATIISEYISIQGRRPGPGSVVGFERWGGVYEHAQVGLIRDARLFTSRAGGRYVIAEPGTGGEAFVPRFGDPARSLAILARAASWYGANVVPANTRAAGGTVVNIDSINVQAGVGSSPTDVGATVVKAIKAYERANTANWRM